MEAKVYIEWGGAYDARNMELIEWEGRFHWEDNTGGYMTLHNQYEPQDSREKADEVLLAFVMNLGEPHTFIEFEDRGVIRKRDMK
jgi:hypothetical protein